MQVYAFWDWPFSLRIRPVRSSQAVVCICSPFPFLIEDFLVWIWHSLSNHSPIGHCGSFHLLTFTNEIDHLYVIQLLIFWSFSLPLYCFLVWVVFLCCLSFCWLLEHDLRTPFWFICIILKCISLYKFL